MPTKTEVVYVNRQGEKGVELCKGVKGNLAVLPIGARLTINDSDYLVEELHMEISDDNPAGTIYVYVS